jgi:hypothetical protein
MARGKAQYVGPRLSISLQMTHTGSNTRSASRVSPRRSAPSAQNAHCGVVGLQRRGRLVWLPAAPTTSDPVVAAAAAAGAAVGAAVAAAGDDRASAHGLSKCLHPRHDL